MELSSFRHDGPFIAHPPPSDARWDATAVAHGGHDTGRLIGQLRTLLAPYDVVIVPGLHNSAARHWQSRWQDLLDARRVAQDDWDHPGYESWVRGLEHTLSTCTRPVILIAHSLGSILVARWAAAQAGRTKVAGAFLVAPADIESPRAMAVEGMQDFLPLPEQPLPFPARIVASGDDEWLSSARARYLATKWHVPLLDAGQRGHIGNDAPLGIWPQGLAWLADLVHAIPAGHAPMDGHRAS
ncbi:Alpha/beta hydrolase family protein (plasmid) [Komagataeibacter saccharivorans]|uniref:Alpha/beta hydrolase family protein n=1 Tax=Komagataeibacter saccharivorans TaxID=265959 RepID=A0A347WGC3_9PROT|nr:alpha/beta hydrolase [Komagataeibacter saccharivorans]AXY23916.1 Alpha/beta hydrolase family protein [Komagataeibacter saccharivorans]